jgi:hypothetical protein
MTNSTSPGSFRTRTRMTTNALRAIATPSPHRRHGQHLQRLSGWLCAFGFAYVSSGLVMLLGGTGLTASWDLIPGVVLLGSASFAMRSANNAFVISRPLGYGHFIACALGIVYAIRMLVTTEAKLGATVEGPGNLGMVALGLFGLVVGIFCFHKCAVGWANAKRHLIPVLDHPHDLGDLAYAVYLRTFAQDIELSRPEPTNFLKWFLQGIFTVAPTQEELVVDALTGDGSIVMIAAGRPGEPAPPMGALRFYLPSSGWKPRVRELIEGARYVVLVLGWGEGALWELAEAVRLLRPEQLILVVAMDEPEYEQLLRETANRLPVGLPGYAGCREIRSAVHGLVTFSEGWEGTFLPIRAYSPFYNSMRIALTITAVPAFRALGYARRTFWLPDAST